MGNAVSRLKQGAAFAALAMACLGGAASAQDVNGRPGLNMYGVTGLIDMPTAESQPDGQFSATTSYFGGSLRNTLTFQMFPRISGSFRYSGQYDLNYGGFKDYYDRSFDISLRILDEKRYRPAVKIGLQDFAGTGFYSGEYIVATKTLRPGLKVTGGLGWGRLGSHGSIGSPFGDRPANQVGSGGKLTSDQWFRGPAAPFGGIEWQVNDRLTLAAEYSSDDYVTETGGGLNGNTSDKIFERRSPFNFGASYRIGERAEVGAYYMYGSEVGVRLSVSLNPRNPPAVPLLPEGAPTAVFPRPSLATNPEVYSEAWTEIPNVEASLFERTQARLDEDGLTLDSMTVDGDTVEVRVRNGRYGAGAQAVGRVARALSWEMPGSIETFRIVPVVQGLPASAVVLRRSDLEALENAPDGAAKLLAVTGVQSAGRPAPEAFTPPETFPRFTWSVGPYLKASYFDPAQPLRLQYGLRFQGTYEPRSGLVFSTSIAQRLGGDITDSDRPASSRLPHVRTDFLLYEKGPQPALERLTANTFFRPGPDLYGRVSAGYLERMFGGVQAEVLWKPTTSRLAIGADIAYARQREPDNQFTFRDYDVITGHISGYYDFGRGYEAQVDVGRYLAGDIGATVTLARQFNNGWKAGAFATITDVSSEDFGEGSFDKGIFFEIPLSWMIGSPTQKSLKQVLRPTQRDGGARLSSEFRLYDMVRPYHQGDLEDTWGRVWR